LNKHALNNNKKFYFTLVFVIGIIFFIGVSLTNLPVGKAISDPFQPEPIERRTTIYVGGTGPNNYSTIQEGIDAANKGDTVFVYDDHSPYSCWNEVIDKSINLIGENKETTVISGHNYSPGIFRITANSVNISGFTLKNGGNDYFARDAAIRIISDYSTISNNIITSNIFGVCIVDASNNNISTNIVTDNDHGIWLENYATQNTIFNNTICNSIEAIDIFDNSSYNTVLRNTIHNNSRGVLLIDTNNNTIRENTVRDHFFKNIQLTSSSDNLIEGNTLIGTQMNQCIYVIMDSSRNIFSHNYVANSKTEGIKITLTCHDNIIDGNCFENNTGDGIRIRTTYGTIITNNNFINNSYGIRIDKCCDTTVVNNQLFFDGITIGGAVDYNDIYYLTSHLVEKNTINGNTI